MVSCCYCVFMLFFFFNDTATTEIYTYGHTLSLHDALPISTQTFAEWQAGFRKQALTAGIRADLFDRAFIGVSPDMSVIKADRSQPEFSRPVWRSEERRIGKECVSTCRSRWSQTH